MFSFISHCRRAGQAALYITLLIAVPAFTQTAKVYELTPGEADDAKALYAEQARVNANIEAFRDGIGKKYFNSDINGCYVSQSTITCGVGFEFSEDFRFVVPKPAPMPVQAWPSNYQNWSPTTVLPNQDCLACALTIPMVNAQ